MFHISQYKNFTLETLSMIIYDDINAEIKGIKFIKFLEFIIHC